MMKVAVVHWSVMSCVTAQNLLRTQVVDIEQSGDMHKPQPPATATAIIDRCRLACRRGVQPCSEAPAYIFAPPPRRSRPVSAPGVGFVRELPVQHSAEKRHDWIGFRHTSYRNSFSCFLLFLLLPQHKDSFLHRSTEAQKSPPNCLPNRKTILPLLLPHDPSTASPSVSSSSSPPPPSSSPSPSRPPPLPP